MAESLIPPLIQSFSTGDRYGYAGVTPELAMREQGLNRKQQIANLLMQRGMQPRQGQMAGRFYVPPSPVQGLADMASVAAGAFGTHLIDQQRKDLSDQDRAMLTEAVQGYQKATGPQSVELAGPGAPAPNGAEPGQGFTPQELDAPGATHPTMRDAIADLYAKRSGAFFQEGPRPTADVPASPDAKRQAIVELMANQHPQAQALGKLLSQQDFMQQERDTNREFLQGENALNRQSQSSIQGAKIDQMMSMGLITQSLGKQMKEELIASNERMNRSTNDTRLEAARIAADAKRDVAGTKADAGRPMSATAQKELIQTEEEMQGSHQAIKNLQSALSVNDQAMGFSGAGAVASAGSLLPDALRPKTVDATVELDNILQGSALPQLKSIFGGMPTEGERKILLDIQGSSGKTASQRKPIIERAIQAAQNRIKFNQQKAEQLRGGTYFSGEGGLETTVGPSASPPAAGGVAPYDDAEKERRYQEYKKKNPK